MFKVDDGFYDSPKLKSIPRGAARKGAVALWALAGSWSDRWSQDGLIPAGQVEDLHCSAKDAQWLVASTLWHDVDNPCPRDLSGEDGKKPCPPCPPGYFLFHDYPDFNDLKVDKDKKKAKARERMRKLRAGDAHSEGNE